MVKSFYETNKYYIIYSLCFLFILYRFFFYDNYRINNIRDSASENMLNEIISEGYVDRKFIDTSYGARNATYITVNGINYELKNIKIYEQIKIGDKVKKEIKSNKVYINDSAYIYVNEQ